MENKWFLCIFIIVDFYDLGAFRSDGEEDGKKLRVRVKLKRNQSKLKNMKYVLFQYFCSSSSTSNNREKSASSIRIINFYYSCQFSLFDFYYPNPLLILIIINPPVFTSSSSLILLSEREREKMKSREKFFDLFDVFASLLSKLLLKWLSIKLSWNFLAEKRQE